MVLNQNKEYVKVGKNATKKARWRGLGQNYYAFQKAMQTLYGVESSIPPTPVVATHAAPL